MKAIKDLREANKVLAGYVLHDVTEAYTLDRMCKLMDFLGNPQNQLRVVHVAGTSGKTSTCYYAAALLQAAGYKVGLTVSPHVVSVNERLQINLEPAPELEFCQILNEFLDVVQKSGVKPTYFELLIAMAYWHFAKQKVDFAVMEVGLGGLLDGTNIVMREDKICAITDIGFDHVTILGKTLPQIAAQKAGIIKPGNVVFSHLQSDEVLSVFKKSCAKQKARFELVESENLGDEFAFLPQFQQRNFTLAQAATSFILQRNDHKPFTVQQLIKAASVRIPARMEVFEYNDKTVILDGAHNAQKLQAFLSSVKKAYPGKKITALISFAANRDYRLIDSLHELSEFVDNLIITTFETGQDFHHKSVNPAEIEAIAKNNKFHSIKVVEDPEEALETLLEQPENVLLVTGSFYMLNHIRPFVLKLKND